MPGNFNRAMLVIKVIGQTLFLFGLLAWLDGVVIQIVNPMWLAAPVSHLFPWLRTDTFTIVMFIASALGFLMWRLVLELLKTDQSKPTS